MTKFARLCEHDRLYSHWLPPEYKEPGRALVYDPDGGDGGCEGGVLFDVDWTAAYAAGEWMDHRGIPDFEKAVEEIVFAALGIEPADVG